MGFGHERLDVYRAAIEYVVREEQTEYEASRIDTDSDTDSDTEGKAE